jgi:hypothetical protein
VLEGGFFEYVLLFFVWSSCTDWDSRIPVLSNRYNVLEDVWGDCQIRT